MVRGSRAAARLAPAWRGSCASQSSLWSPSSKRRLISVSLGVSAHWPVQVSITASPTEPSAGHGGYLPAAWAYGHRAELVSFLSTWGWNNDPCSPHQDVLLLLLGQAGCGDAGQEGEDPFIMPLPSLQYHAALILTQVLDQCLSALTLPLAPGPICLQQCLSPAGNVWPRSEINPCYSLP